ncbi:thioredoxin reductase [Arthrobacter sp. SW1]|uniref:NAD(P)/FAD-dependent oxidoreductase n=1 Tax=Arthrobacter sp. SW1 TaxID=1920889 RepID=UPI000877DFC6|nr:NAD(P)/FAD-dependent oxidoreductase [Arthrobacter sp. SW1]OFI39094.1 thioredoxin reductase [Arthrobacter sp. SW1]
MSEYDVVVIGGGAAGLSAALVLSRAGRRVLVVDAGAPRNAPAAHMHGFLSRDGMPPGGFLALGREEVAGYGGEVIDGVVRELVPDGGTGFWVLLADTPGDAGGRRISARRVLVATGLRDELPEIEGLAELWGKDVLHCPYCHGYEVRDRPLGVIGSTPDSVRYVQLIRQWAKDVVLFVPEGLLTVQQEAELTARAIGTVEGTVQRVLSEDGHLSGVEMADGRVVPRGALFVPPRFVPNNGLLSGLGCGMDDAGWVATDAGGQTSVRGVYVAGNLANPRAQVITAASEGSMAAATINADLVEEDIKEALHSFKLGY